MEIKNANDRTTYMTGMEKCVRDLQARGFNDQYKMRNGRMYSLNSGNEFMPDDVKAVNFYRFEGVSDPDDMSILYAIETNDGNKGILIDAYGFYADTEIGQFMQQVEIRKKTTDTPL